MQHAVVLVGGLGTRVRELTQDRLPKPLLDINGEPFLALQLRWLKTQGIKQVTLASGHLSDVIRDRLGDRFEGLALRYSDEGDVRMGTGGALRLALANDCIPADAPFFALNGDTWFPVDLAALAQRHRDCAGQATLALRQVSDLSRYGAVHFDEGNRVTAFGEKSGVGAGWINGGVYLLEPTLLFAYKVEPFSLEQDVLAPMAGKGGIFALPSHAEFCDIGTPEDYRRFCEEHRS